jgi:hypothetical protein
MSIEDSLKQLLGFFVSLRIGDGAGKSPPGRAEAERIAHGLGASAPELHTVAGKWADAVEPLNRGPVALDAAIHRS